jgi:hypothetical protein
MASVLGTCSIDSPTLYSFQRKTFYANGRFWAFYSNGTNMVYCTSTDGLTWTSPTTVRFSSLGYRFSVWFDGTYLHYAYADNSQIYYRRGTPNSDGTITWSADEQIVSTTYNAALYPMVSVDSNGYVWIGYNEYRIAGAKYYPYVIKSGNNDGTWGTTPSGFPYQLSSPSNSEWYVSIIPLTTGKMLAIYAYTSTIKAKKWTGSSWGSEVATTSSIYRGEAHSAVAQGDDVHLVFLKNTGYDILYTKYTYSSNSFGTEITLQASATSTSNPVISIDTSTNNLYVFWAGYPTANHIYYRKYNGTSWETAVDWIAETQLTSNYCLTCSYKNYGDKIGLEYTTTQGITRYVKFDFLSTVAGVTYYQSLPATEVAVCSLSTIMIWSKLLSVVESSITNLSRIASYYKSLIVTEVSNVVMSLAKTFYRNLSVVESSIVNLAKGLFSTLSVIESSVVSLITAKFFSKALSVIESSVAILSRIVSYYRSLIVTEVSNVVMSLVKTFYRTLSVIESSIANLIKGISKTLSVVESSVVSLAKGLFYTVSMAITEVSVAIISKISTFLKSLLVTEISVPSLGKIANYFRSLSVVESSIAGLSKVASFFRSLAVTEISIPIMSLIKSFYRTLSSTVVSISELIANKISGAVYYVEMVATEVSVVTINLVKSFYRTLLVVESSVASLFKGLSKTLSAVGSSVVSLEKLSSFFRTLMTTEISIPSLSKISQYFRSLETTEISIASLVPAKFLYQLLSAIEVSVSQIGKTISKILYSIEVSITSLGKISSFFRTLAATEVSIPTLTRLASLFRKLEATVVSLPVLRSATTFFKQIYATMISVPSLIAQKFEKVIRVFRHISLSRFIRWF